ncbi:MAG TPA: hypothetical protein VGG91_23845 [Myxococcaceae bacterium]
MRPLPARPVQAREARTSRAAASSDAEKIAGRIVECGTPVEEANWSMLWCARWLIPRESAEVLSTARRVTCSIEETLEAALIAIRCRTPSLPTDPIAMNTVRIPWNASVSSRGSSRRWDDVQPATCPERAAGLVGVANDRGDRLAARQQPADDLAAHAACGADHGGGHGASFAKGRRCQTPSVEAQNEFSRRKTSSLRHRAACNFK